MILADSIRALAVVAASIIGIGQNEALVVSFPDEALETLVFAAAGAAFIARRSPLLALPVALLLDALPYWLPVGGAGFHLSVLIAIYYVASREAGRRAFPVLTVVIAVQATLMAWDMDWQWFSMYVAIAVLSDLVPAAFGLAARSRALTAEALTERARAAERTRDADAQKLLAEDRLRTARNVHDSVAHQIAVMSLNASVASQSLRSRPHEAESALANVREAGRGAIASISDLLTSLRSGHGDEPGSSHTLADVQTLIDEFRQLLPRLEVTVGDGSPAPTTAVSDVLFNGVREALTNAYKHGEPDQPVDVQLRVDGAGSRLRVRNVSAPGRRGPTTGFGLTGMKERLAAEGGWMSTEHAAGTFTLNVHVPAGEVHE